MDRPELKKKIYDIVLAIRTEGIIRGKTKQFAESDTEEILALIPDVDAEYQQKLAEIFEEIEKHERIGLEFTNLPNHIHFTIPKEDYGTLKSRILGGKP